MKAGNQLGLLALVGGLALAGGCQSDPDKALKNRIEVAEGQLAPYLSEDGEEGEWNEEAEKWVQSLLRDYATYANGHHGDEWALRYQMRRADLLQGLGKHEMAIQQWMDVMDADPQSALAAEAMFRVGFLRETALADTVGALKAYSEILRVYPESQWAEPAASASKWLTFNEENFIRALRNGTEDKP